MWLIFICILVFLTNHFSSAEKYRIFLKDKGIANFTYGSPEFRIALKSISERSVFRRTKILPKELLVSIEDLPIPENYLKEIEKTGAKIILKLKWLNYIVVEANQIQINRISKLDFVKYIQPISEIVPKIITNKISSTHFKFDITKWFYLPAELNNRYGESINQLKMLSIDQLHSLGIMGDSVILGIIDTGFRWKENRIFKNANVLKEFDFIYQDYNTENEPNDTTFQDHHGTMVFSIISGIKEGFLFGSAPYATFVLAKTEDIRKETHFEEDCFAAAIEWMDSIGVDIITSSLGYSKFDSSEANYSIEHFDGKTALVSAYANRAKKIGITMISSAGNRGPNDSTIQAPAEALGEIAVGAVNPTADTILKFSSRGPTYDGRIKPDFVAQGNYVICSPAIPFDTTIYGSGTSVASPIFAGGVALLLSAFEELTPEVIYQMLKNYASRKNNPDNSWGFGIPDFYTSAFNYDIIISPPFTFPHSGKQRVVFKIKHPNQIEFVKIHFRRPTELIYNSDFLNPIYSDDLYFIDFTQNSSDSAIYFYITVKASNGKVRRKPFFEPNEFKINFGESSKNLFLLPEPLTTFRDLNLTRKINIYPTVLTETNEIYIEINDLQGERIQVQLFDTFGKKLEEFSIGNNLSKSSIHKYFFKEATSGIYFLRIITSSGFTKVQRLLKVF